MKKKDRAKIERWPIVQGPPNLHKFYIHSEKKA